MACWNVRIGLIKREKEIEEMLREHQLDILFLVETDTNMIMSEKDYKLKGYKTIFQNKKEGTEKTRIIALCKENYYINCFCVQNNSCRHYCVTIIYTFFLIYKSFQLKRS